MTFLQKFTIGYFSSMSVYGFYRGYNSLYKEEFKQVDPFVTNRFVCGIGGAFMQTNPVTQLYGLHGIALRTEKTLRGIELTADDYEH